MNVNKFLLLAGLHCCLLQVLFSWSPPADTEETEMKKGDELGCDPPALPAINTGRDWRKTEQGKEAAAFSGWAVHSKGDSVHIKPHETRHLQHSFWKHTLRGSLKIRVSSWWGSHHRVSTWQPDQKYIVTLAGVIGSFKIHFNNSISLRISQNEKAEFFTMPFFGLLELFAKWSNTYLPKHKITQLSYWEQASTTQIRLHW